MREPLGLILAGGKATRMGGWPKADVLLGGRRLLDHTAMRLEPQVGEVVVNANGPTKTNFPTIADTLEGHLGPLAGVLAGLKHGADTGYSHVVSVAVDTPFFPCDLVPQLLMAGTAHPHGFAMAQTADGVQGAFALWPVALRDPLRDFLTAGERKVRAFAEAHNAAYATFPVTEPDAFFNINTPDDLAQADGWL